jgi:peptide-methionine (S)-S-oxide reductase
MSIDRLFQQAVVLIGAGDVPAPDRLLTEHPELARERLAAPGPWLRDKIGGALDGFFKDPYLLWFVAEDVPVHGRLPENITAVARTILRSAQGMLGFQELLDSTLRLVCWSGVHIVAASRSNSSTRSSTPGRRSTADRTTPWSTATSPPPNTWSRAGPH